MDHGVAMGAKLTVFRKHDFLLTDAACAARDLHVGLPSILDDQNIVCKTADVCIRVAGGQFPQFGDGLGDETFQVIFHNFCATKTIIPAAVAAELALGAGRGWP
jgi:hypothetical protein